MEYTVLLQPAILAASILGTVFYLGRAVRHRHGDAVKAAVVIAATGLTLTSALVVTPEGHRGVVYSAAGGINQTERVEGVSFIVPYFQSAVQMDVRTRKFFTDEAFAQSSDLQEITVHVAVNYHVDPSRAADLFQNVGRGYEDVLIRPAVFQLVKEQVGLVKAVDFARSREELASAIGTRLATRLEPAGVTVEFVAIEDAVFDPDFISSVKDKVIADEKAEESARLVVKATNDARAVVETAQGRATAIEVEAEAQASANRVIAGSLTQDLLVWQRILQWSGQLPDTVLGGDPLDVIVDLP